MPDSTAPQAKTESSGRDLHEFPHGLQDFRIKVRQLIYNGYFRAKVYCEIARCGRTQHPTSFVGIEFVIEPGGFCRGLGATHLLGIRFP